MTQQINTIEQLKEMLQSRLGHILGEDFIVSTDISKLGGADRASLVLEIYGKNPAYGIKYNSPTHMHIWAHDCLKAAKNWECEYRNRAIKFRKIKAKSFQELHEKLCDYIRKIKPQLIQLEGK